MNQLDVFSEQDAYGYNARQFARGDVEIRANLREIGKGRHKVNIVDLSRSGFRFWSPTLIMKERPVALTIPTFAALEAKIAWNSRDFYGAEFLQPLHEAIFDHILVKFPSLRGQG